jgi:hypothetical protein
VNRHHKSEGKRFIQNQQLCERESVRVDENRDNRCGRKRSPSLACLSPESGCVRSPRPSEVNGTPTSASFDREGNVRKAKERQRLWDSDANEGRKVSIMEEQTYCATSQSKFSDNGKSEDGDKRVSKRARI